MTGYSEVEPEQPAIHAPAGNRPDAQRVIPCNTPRTLIQDSSFRSELAFRFGYEPVLKNGTGANFAGVGS
jgi:hypothetical protein